MMNDDMNMGFHSNLNLKEEMPSLGTTSSLGPDQFFWGNGKVLLAGEYLVLEGGKGLGLPTRWGQSLSVRYNQSFTPILHWKSYDYQGNIWFEARFEFWRFNLLDDNTSEAALILQKILRQARKQNPHFLRDDVEVIAETKVSFPMDWGLGSSSTLIHNIASWAFTGPFELLFKTMGGSGIDVAVAQADGPILYEKKGATPQWSHVQFSPPFATELYFVYLGKKQKTSSSVELFKKKQYSKEYLNKIIMQINPLVDAMISCTEGDHFSNLMNDHEAILSKLLEIPSIRLTHFSDFNGTVKSLGAWGGDFILAYSKDGKEKVEEYFKSKNCSTILTFDQMVFSGPVNLMNNFTSQVNYGTRH